MRDYLFRGKRKFGDEWLEGLPVWLGVTHIVGSDGFCPEGIQTREGSLCSIIPETVGEYTGLTDKNGKKIFEGDIVICIYDGTEHTYQIIWDISELDFKAAINKENYGKCFEYLPCCDEIEVIGNIHDNPELLVEGRK